MVSIFLTLHGRYFERLGWYIYLLIFVNIFWYILQYIKFYKYNFQSIFYLFIILCSRSSPSTVGLRFEFSLNIMFLGVISMRKKYTMKRILRSFEIWKDLITRSSEFKLAFIYSFSKSTLKLFPLKNVSKSKRSFFLFLRELYRSNLRWREIFAALYELGIFQGFPSTKGSCLPNEI